MSTLHLSKMSTPIVSVIIPVFNSDLYFKKCLDSVLSQSLYNIEVIIINDGSTDDSVIIAEDRAKNDNRIKLIHLQGPLGAGVARNKGLELARGEWIAFLDSDDFYPDNYVLELLVDKAQKHNATVCGGSLYTIDCKDKIISKNIKFQVFKEEGWIDYRDYQFEGGFYRFIYHKNVIKNKFYFPHFKRYQDPVFLVEVLSSVKNFYVVNRYTYAYRKYKKIDMTEDILSNIFSGIEIINNNAITNRYRNLKKRMRYIYWKIFFKNFNFLLKHKRCFLNSLKVGYFIHAPSLLRINRTIKYKKYWNDNELHS